MKKDFGLRKAFLIEEYKNTFRMERRLKEQELKLMKRRKVLVQQLNNQNIFEPQMLNT